MRVVTQQGQRDQEELLAKALVTLQEARNAHQEELELHRDRQHQQDICLQLRNKVSGWYPFRSHGITYLKEHLQLCEMDSSLPATHI